MPQFTCPVHSPSLAPADLLPPAPGVRQGLAEVHRPRPPPGEDSLSGPAPGGTRLGAQFLGLGVEVEFIGAAGPDGAVWSEFNLFA